MRSNDAWYGLCYDLFQFAQVQLTVARCLGVPAGRYFHSAASLHLYERHWGAAGELAPPPLAYTGRPLDGIGWQDGQEWGAARARAWALLHGQSESLRYLTPTERWYADMLAPYDPAGD
jgi:hypothetical protein